jgi:archaellum biogenesis ATPase FlaH
MKIPLKTLNDQLNAIKNENDLLSIWGEFGVGKTLFSIQIALENVSKNNQVYYIYSKPNLPIENLKDMIERKKSVQFDNFIMIHMKNFKELYLFNQRLESAFLNDLKRNREPPKLMIFDSITDLYRLVLNKEKKGSNVKLNYKLNFILATIYFLKKRFDLDIIIVNESSRKMQKDEYYEIQSGGKVMDYWVSCSFHIERTDSLSKRKISLIKDGEVKVDYYLSLTNNGFKL